MGVPDGPFEGVPFLLKDLTQSYAGVPTDCGSRFFKGWTRDFDSEMVARWKRAGAVIFAKTNTPEGGSSGSTEPVANGPTHNPWKLGYSPGCSQRRLGLRGRRRHRAGRAMPTTAAGRSAFRRRPAAWSDSSPPAGGRPTGPTSASSGMASPSSTW